MNRIIVNASGAKIGGAVTILNSFCKSKRNDNLNYYYILSPHSPLIMPLNSSWIKLETSGLSTLLFSLFFSVIYYIKYDCCKIISFSNINSVFPVANRVTYFHNLLICNEYSFKYKLLRFLLVNFNQKKSLYIFQTNFVKKEFVDKLGFTPKYKICWPGFDLKFNKKHNIYHDDIYYVVPITNLKDSHKNFKLIIDIANEAKANKLAIKIFVTADCDINTEKIPSNIEFLGNLCSDDFMGLIQKSQGVIISSTLETVCLPIFESLFFNKPAFVYEADYLKGIVDEFGVIDGLYVFDNASDFITKEKMVSNIDNNFFCETYKVGNWDL